MMAFPHYQTIDNWRTLSVSDEEELYRKKLNRVTDVCIPEEEAIRTLEEYLLNAWEKASTAGRRQLPHHYFYEFFAMKRC